MFSRKEQDSHGAPLPQDWLDELQASLQEHYQAECQDKQGEFKTHGQLYQSELVLIITFNQAKQQRTVSCFLSCDLGPKEATKKVLYSLVDLAGHFYNDFFSDQDWNDFSTSWEKIQYQKRDVYYRVSREDVELTLLANELLA